MSTVTINVGGKIFVTYEDTLQTIPDTKLATLSKDSSSEFDKDNDWFFFDRSSAFFECVLDLYRNGSLHIPHDLCGGKVIEELEFWEIPLDRLDDCCYGAIRKYTDDSARMAFLKTKFDESGKTSLWKPISIYCQSCLRDHPKDEYNAVYTTGDSLIQEIYAVIYYMLVLLTCVTFVIRTHPTFRIDRVFDPEVFAYVDHYNNTHWIKITDYFRNVTKNPKELMYILTEVKPSIYIMDVTCYLIFTVDLAVRFLVTPSKKMLLKTILIYFDIILIIANTTSFILERNPDVFKSNERLLYFLIVCKTCVILRLFRLLKLTRHLSGMKVMVLSFKTSSKDLAQLALPVMITVLIMSGIMYYAEFQDGNTFQNIPITIWWCVVTMTTVGYGDVTPSTYFGYAIASVCAITGLILIAMPVAIIASNFDGLRNLNSIREQKESSVKDREAKTKVCIVKSANLNQIWCSPDSMDKTSTRLET